MKILNRICSHILTINCILMGILMPLHANNETQTIKLIQEVLEIKNPILTEILSGGCSGSKLIKVSTDEKTYVVRYWNIQWADYFPQDLACQLIASDAGYGPRVHYADATKCITIMDYCEPEALPKSEVRLKAIVELLKKIHMGPLVPEGVDRAKHLEELIKEVEISQLFNFEHLKIIKSSVFAATLPGMSRVTCHRDLHHGNLIYNKGIFFAIDYTWGAMDDPYVDLANIVIFNCENAIEERLLLELYLGRSPNRAELARLSLMKLQVKMFYGLTFLSMALENSKDNRITPTFKPRSYISFGQHDRVKMSPSDYFDHACALINEVIEYSLSEYYSNDLKEISQCAPSS